MPAALAGLLTLAGLGSGGDDATAATTEPTTLRSPPKTLHDDWRTVCAEGSHEMRGELATFHLAGPYWLNVF